MKNINNKKQIDILFQTFDKVTVQFTKADKTQRTMRCTTNSVPAKFRPKEDTPEPADIKRVFDLDKQGWRSFRIDSVMSLMVEV